MLRRKAGRIVKVLARGMSDYRPSSDEREPLATGRMLVITACRPDVRAPPVRQHLRAIDSCWRSQAKSSFPTLLKAVRSPYFCTTGIRMCSNSASCRLERVK